MRCLALLLLAGCSLITDPGQFEGGDASRADSGDAAAGAGDATVDGGDPDAEVMCPVCTSETYCLAGTCTSCDFDMDGYLADSACMGDPFAPLDCNDDEIGLPALSLSCGSVAAECRLGQGVLGEGDFEVAPVFAPAGVMGSPRSDFGPDGQQHGDLFVALHSDKSISLLLGPAPTRAATLRHYPFDVGGYGGASFAGVPSSSSITWPFQDPGPYEVCLARFEDRLYIGGVGQRTDTDTSARAALLAWSSAGGEETLGGSAGLLLPRSACVVAQATADTATFHWIDGNFRSGKSDGGLVVTSHGAVDTFFPWMGGGAFASAAVGAQLHSWSSVEDGGATMEAIASSAVGPLANASTSTVVPTATASLLVSTTPSEVAPGYASDVPLASVVFDDAPGSFLVAEAGPDAVRLRRVGPGETIVLGLDLPELANARAVALDYRPNVGAVVAIIDASGQVKVQRIDLCPL